VALTNSTTSKTVALPNVQIPTHVQITKHSFTEYFKGFEKVPAVREIFGDKTGEVLRKLKVEFFGSRYGYMGVSDEDGHLIVSAHYLKEGDTRSVYLDVIHELVHVRQFMEGRALFDESYEYVDRPTELEAYKHALKEARRLGMSDGELFEYLKVTWLDEEEVKRLARNLGVVIPEEPHPARRARVS
jgi:hypothetical protein